MASIEFELDQFQKGNLVAWNIATQCWYDVEIKIYAGSKVYYTGEKPFERSGDMKKLAIGNAVLETGNPLMVKVNIPKSAKIGSNVVSGAISDRRARRVGYIYDICLEDGADTDYNDVYINIVGWKN